MRKISLIGFVMLIVSIPTFAGGLLTNTNQHVAFLPNDGFHMGCEQKADA